MGTCAYPMQCAQHDAPIVDIGLGIYTELDRIGHDRNYTCTCNSHIFSYHSCGELHSIYIFAIVAHTSFYQGINVDSVCASVHPSRT